MARGVKLSEFEKGQIAAHKSNGKTQAEIARLLNRTRACISQYLKRAENPLHAPRRMGRPPKLSNRTMRRVMRSLRYNRGTTCRQLIAQHHLRVSKMTLSRALKRNNCCWRKMRKQPNWKPNHIAARLNFAREKMTWNREWRTVIFSDEKKFNLDGPDGFKSYWHCLGSSYQHYSKRVGGGASLMMWCGFGYGGKFNLHVMRGRVTALRYQEMLHEINLVEEGTLFAGEGFTFQQDNAPPHSVRIN